MTRTHSAIFSAILFLARPAATSVPDETISFDSSQVNSYISPKLWLGNILQGGSRRLLEDHNQEDQRRQLSGADCRSFRIQLRKSEVNSAAIKTNSAYVLQVPFYEIQTKRKLGTWSETLTFSDEAQTQGLGSISLTWNSETSLAVRGVFGQRLLAITGGSGIDDGDGVCPSGFGYVYKNEADTVDLQFDVCNACP